MAPSTRPATNRRRLFLGLAVAGCGGLALAATAAIQDIDAYGARDLARVTARER